jgi:cold shock CspA family protein
MSYEFAGTVVTLVEDQGFGFIRMEAGRYGDEQDVFVHLTGVSAEYCRVLGHR